jgi:small-conductance mechanosensitive channel
MSKYIQLIIKPILFALLVFLKSKYELSFTGAKDPHLVVFINFVLFYLGIDTARLIINILYRKRIHLDIKLNDNFTLGVQHMRSILIFFAFAFSILSLFDIDIKAVFTSLSIVAAAIAIISKDYISNLINGMIITFSNQISLDDYVQIGQHKGKISDIGLINISMLSDDDDMIYIPHNTAFAAEIINFTKKDSKKTSIEFDLDMAYLPTVNELENNLIETVQVFKEHIQEDSYHLKIVSIKKDTVSLKFQYLVQKRDRELEKRIRKNTIREVLDYIQSIKNRSV